MKMLDEIGENIEDFFPIEEPSEVEEFFDINCEFDAPQYYDFDCLETDSEAKEAELWFESAGSYPPSSFAIELNWRFGIYANGESGTGSIYDDREESNCFKEDNNLRAKSSSLVKSSIFRSSTLMKPTASYLAKQIHTPAVCPNRFERRFQKFSVSFDDKSSKNASANEGNATKRQKLEAGYLCKGAHLTNQTLFMHKKPKTVQSLDGNPVHAKYKATIPREPELHTARRAQRRRGKVKAESNENANSKNNFFKALPLNRKILESPSLPLTKKSLPQQPEFQLFHLRTSERARQYASNNAIKLPNYVSSSRFENTDLRRFNSINDLTEEKSEAVNKFKYESCPLNNKVISSKGETGDPQKMKEFKFLANRTLLDEPPIELLNKLSLSSEDHSGEKSRAKTALSIMNVAKENLQRNRGTEHHCRSDTNKSIEQQLAITGRSLRLA